MQRLAGWCAEACVACIRKCHYAVMRSAAQIPSPAHEHPTLRCAAPPQHSPALLCAALHRKWRLRNRLASAHCTRTLRLFASALLVARCHRPRVRLRCGRPDRRHSRASRVRVHALPCAHSRVSASPTQTAGAPAAPQPTVQAGDDSSAPLYTKGASTHSTRGQYVEHHCEYLKYPTAGAPPPPTVEAVNDTSAPRHGHTAAQTAGVLMCRVPASEYSTRPHVSNAM